MICSDYLVFSGIAQLVNYLSLCNFDFLFLTQLWNSCDGSVGSCVSSFVGSYSFLLSFSVRASMPGGYRCVLNVHEKPPLSSMNLVVYGSSRRAANTGVIPKKSHMPNLMSTSFFLSTEMVFFTSTPMVSLPERCSA